MYWFVCRRLFMHWIQQSTGSPALSSNIVVWCQPHQSKALISIISRSLGRSLQSVVDLWSRMGRLSFSYSWMEWRCIGMRRLFIAFIPQNGASSFIVILATQLYSFLSGCPMNWARECYLQWFSLLVRAACCPDNVYSSYEVQRPYRIALFTGRA